MHKKRDDCKICIRPVICFSYSSSNSTNAVSCDSG